MNRTIMVCAAVWLAAPLVATADPPEVGVVPEAAALVQRYHGYRGTVTAVDGRSITIRGIGHPYATLAERWFPASNPLAKGEVPDDERDRYGYKLSDIKIGDKVHISFNRVPGRATCTAVLIERRPGGRVPVPSNDPGVHGIRHAEYMNALQDREERGTPLPAKFDPPTPVAETVPSLGPVN